MAYQNVYQENTWHSGAAYNYPTQQQTQLYDAPPVINRQQFDIMGSPHHPNPGGIYGTGTPGGLYLQDHGVDGSLGMPNTGLGIDLMSYFDDPTLYMGTGSSSSTAWPAIQAPALPYIPTPPTDNMHNVAGSINMPDQVRRQSTPRRVARGQSSRSRSPSRQPANIYRDVRIVNGYTPRGGESWRTPSYPGNNLRVQQSLPPRLLSPGRPNQGGVQYRVQHHPTHQEPEISQHSIPSSSPNATPVVRHERGNREPPRSIKDQRDIAPQQVQPATEEPPRNRAETPAPATDIPARQITPPPPLEDGLSFLVDEIRRLDAEAEIAKAAEECEQREREQRAEEERRMMESLWPGDLSAYPSEATRDLQLPQCEYRVQTVHVGRPKEGFSDRANINVYAIRHPGSESIEYRLAKGVWSPQEIVEGGHLVAFGDIRPSVFFEDMSQAKAELWIKQLLSHVPGQNDSVMKWTRDVPAEGGGGDNIAS